MASVHLCGVCDGSFDTEDAYAAHDCSTGHKPTDPAHLGKGFEAASAAAVARGEARKGQ